MCSLRADILSLSTRSRAAGFYFDYRFYGFRYAG